MKDIRTAASLLVVRDDVDGVEVLTIKRSQSMRFLPGFLAFPGGSLDPSDAVDANAALCGTVVAQGQADDLFYAYGALRECAEEVGWLCAERGSEAPALLDSSEQTCLLQGEKTFLHLLSDRDTSLDASQLRFVGRWVTPETMPARFDTRFFLYKLTDEAPEVRMVGSENEWVRWCHPKVLLNRIAVGEEQAVPPTIAMLTAISKMGSTAEGFGHLFVPGPTDL